MPREPQENPQDRIRELQIRLDEANETIRAFSSGEVDAIVASGPEGDRVYTLKGADETYRVMVQEMAEGALTLTTDGLILFSNQQFASMLGCPLERVIGSPILEFIAQEDARIVSALFNETDGTTAEARLSPDGKTFVPVYLSVRKVILDGAECYCLIVTDLSAQKRYEEMVAVMEAVPVGVFIAGDPKCLTITANRMACELLRLPHGTNISLTPKSWREFRDGREIPPEEMPIRMAASTGQPVHDYEFDMEFDDGTSRCWLGSAVPLFDDLRRPRGAVGAFVDITDRKRAEEKLGSANAELRSFAYALAHGLQEPLGKVVEFQRQLTPEAGDTGRHQADSVASALKMETLLKELIRYWEVTERSGDSLSPVDCKRAFSEARHNLEDEIRRSGAIVTAGPLPTVVANEVMLVQVFQNLIGNSIRYRSEAAPEINISAVRAGDRWLFSVRDNGVGVERADAERIFGMFSSPQGEGVSSAGVGLALCRKVVERHGGRIWVESRAGHGAAFRFTIPIYLDSVLPDSLAVSVASGI